MEKINATYQQRRQIDDLLKETCIKQQDGTCDYVQGWSDKAIAAKISPTLNAGHVANMRKKLGYGNLMGSPYTKSNEANEIIQALQSRVAKLEWQFSLVERHLWPSNNLRNSASLDALEVRQQAKQ